MAEANRFMHRGQEGMGSKVQCAGLIFSTIGISGIAGAIENGTGLVQSVILLAVGALILYRTCRSETR